MAELVQLRETSQPARVRTLASVDGYIPPSPDDTAWATLLNGDKPYAMYDLEIDVLGSIEHANDCVITYRNWVKGLRVSAPHAAADAFVSQSGYDKTATRPRESSGVVVLKTSDAGAHFTNYTGTTVVLNSIDTLANGDYVLVGYKSQFHGLDAQLSNPNSNASVLSVASCNDGTWTSVGASLTDGTTNSGESVTRNGQITYERPAAWTKGVPAAIKAVVDSAATIDADDYYWVRLSWSAALDSATGIATLGVLLPIRVSGTVRVHGGRQLLVAIAEVASAAGITDAGTLSVVGRIMTAYC